VQGLLCMVTVGVLSLLMVTPVHAGTLYESPYVSFSPDYAAWTVHEEIADPKYYRYFELTGTRPDYWYPMGERVETGIASSLRALEEGEHYYTVRRYGEVPVKYWEVVHPKGRCIHNSNVNEWHGVLNVGPEGLGDNCSNAYYSGWFAYCADCGGQITTVMAYMSKDAAETITFLDMGLGYYYCCPSCANIENAFGAVPHECQAISFNRYRVVYDKNAENPDSVAGYMEDSYHMYNNEDVYRGERVTPITRLSRNVYTRTGYVFTGWNTAPDGSGTHYEDCAEILNLSVYNYADDNERGTVTLYAQWEAARSTLVINPNGGSYDGRTGNTVLENMPYGETYYADPAKVVAPLGYQVSFATNGGQAISPMRPRNIFTGWKQSEPFHGRIRDNLYAFRGADGITDTLTAMYNPGSITLPVPVRQGYSFGGWFADAGGTKPVGLGGELYTPRADTTLYAKWVELVLHSRENYIDNDGKGAVDLSWSQSDGRDKVYKLYGAEGDGDFALLYGARETVNRNETDRSFVYQGVTEQYTVPYSGFYELSAFGAQGGSYGSHVGGLGGKTTAKMYLSAGEKLTVTVGGNNRYNGGGAGTMYGNGGGATTIVSDRRGTLMIAGGGGGAGPEGNGSQGGAEESLRTDGISLGEDGMAGGGSGRVGGKAGEHIVHTHTQDCINLIDTSYGFNNFPDVTYADFNQDPNNITISNGSIHVHGHTNTRNNTVHIDVGSSTSLLPTNGNTLLEIPFYFYSWGNLGYIMQGGCMVVYDQNGTGIAQFNMADSYTAEKYENYTHHYWIAGSADGKSGKKTFTVNLPEGTTGVWVRVWLPIYKAEEVGAWVTTDIGTLYFSGGTRIEYICGYEEGQVISSKSAYGGSNYIQTGCATYFQSERGVQSGNGAAQIKAVSVGFMETLSLNGIAAPDKVAPERISNAEEDLVLEAEGDDAVNVTFKKPNDRGTTYRYKAESYLVGTDTCLSTSNITSETLITKVKGYYYKFNTILAQTVTAENADNRGNLLPCTGNTETVRVILAEDVMYLHIAAVDYAGNVGETATIEINRQEMAWDLATSQIAVSDNVGGREYHSIYHKDANTYYVCADGRTPFMLSYQSYLRGEARADYQIDYQIFDVTTDSKHQRYSTKLPYSVPLSSENALSVSDFIREMLGDSLLKDAMNTGALRKRNGTENEFFQAFTIPQSYHGKTFVVTPVAGATDSIVGSGEETIVYSDWNEDCSHSVELIADGEAPLISGLEVLENKNFIQDMNGNITLNLVAYDELSGLKDFYLEISNMDNYASEKLEADRNGCITLTVTEDDRLLSGDVVITAYAVDCVGNESEISYGATEFGLTAKVERILAPHEPIFKSGESGVLAIDVWGYADRLEVEFPEAFVQQNPDLNKTYLYGDSPQYRQEEIIRFMVPLNVTAEAPYTITVRAYKNGQMLAECPDLHITVNGSVVEEIRTRLR